MTSASFCCKNYVSTMVLSRTFFMFPLQSQSFFSQRTSHKNNNKPAGISAFLTLSWTENRNSGGSVREVLFKCKIKNSFSLKTEMGKRQKLILGNDHCTGFIARITRSSAAQV